MNNLFKRKRHVHQLTVGLRTQLCKECHDLQTRLCEVDGKTCLFHRWIDEDQALLKIDVFYNTEERTRLVKHYQQDGIVPLGCSTEVVRKTFALVEYPDGSIGKVDPVLVTFLDKEVKG